MADVRASGLLAHLAELERLDGAAAVDLTTLETLSRRAGAIRARAAEVRAELARVPLAFQELEHLKQGAVEESDAARAQLEEGEARLAALERSRRKRTDEIERARREVGTARELVADANTRIERLDRRQDDLTATEKALRAEVGALARAAHGVAAELGPLPRIGDATRNTPGGTLEDLEAWGALVHSGLFVARGTVVAEREQIVSEANALGESVIGATLGVLSVELVRRRLEEELVG